MSDPTTIKLSSELIQFIKKSVDVAKLANIDNLIIEEGRVRGMDDDTTVFICHNSTTDIPKLPFGSIGLTRIGVFASRLDIADGTGKMTVIANVDESADPSYVRSLKFTGAGVKIDYRCANPTLLKAPKQVADPVTYSAVMTSDAVVMISKGQSAMSADELIIAGSKSGVTLEMKDVNSDVLEFELCDEVTLERDDVKVPDFYYRYPIKTVGVLFKNSVDNRFYITQKGILVVTVDGLTVYVMPRSD